MVITRSFGRVCIVMLVTHYVFAVLAMTKSLRPSNKLPSYVIKPLIDGPWWLPIHVATKVYYERANSSQGSFFMDFVPCDPAKSSAKLLRGESVPGKFRVFTIRRGMFVDASMEEKVYAAKLLHRCSAEDPSFDEKSLHLVRFNCWSFAFVLTRVLIMRTASDSMTSSDEK